MSEVRDGGREERAGWNAEAEKALFADVSEVLDGERTLWRAAERIVALAAPYVDESCLNVPLTAGFNIDIVSRTILRRAHESLAAVMTMVDSASRTNARVHLRVIAEDLIFVKWLLGLDETVATKYVRQSARVEALRAVEAQLKFLPSAYESLNTTAPHLGFGDPSDALRRARDELSELCRAQGWGGRAPSVRAMADAADLLPMYEFFYFLSSKTVHANLHEMARIVWGNEDAVNITSGPVEGIDADLAVVYGVWLFSSLLEVLSSSLPPVERLLSEQAYSVWLALLLVGPARNGKLPLLIHPEEFRWRGATDARPS